MEHDCTSGNWIPNQNIGDYEERHNLIDTVIMKRVKVKQGSAQERTGTKAKRDMSKLSSTLEQF
jgi:hypothetical protein